MGELVSSVSWIFVSTLALFALLDWLASTVIKKQIFEYVTAASGSINTLPSIAGKLFEGIFGARHISLRCLLSSVIASIISITVMYVGRIILFLLIYRNDPHFSEEYAQYIWSELTYPFREEVRVSFLVSMFANFILDYLSLFKTRMILRYLLRNDFSFLRSAALILLDFAFSFVLFQMWSVVLYFVSLFVTFGTGQMFLPAGDARIFMSAVVEILIMLDFLTNPGYPKGTFLNWITHSHAIPVILSATLVPLYITSVFFYASIMPSIWLWLFLLAGLISRGIAPLYPSALYALNFEQTPLRIIGFILAIFLSLAWVVFLIVVIIYFEGVLWFLSSWPR
jgi:hypothetical protein